MENYEKTNDKTNDKDRGLTMALIGIILVIVVVVIVVSINRNDKNSSTNNSTGQTQNSNSDSNQDGTLSDASTDVNKVTDLEVVKVPNAETAKVVVPGANAITSDNIVVTELGTAAQSDGQVMGENAPRQTGFLNRDELSEEVVKLNIGNRTISPNSFTTTVGAPTTFSVTGVDSYSHVIAFDNPVLSAVAILVGPNQTKAITFQAPNEPGTYDFKCVSPNHSDKGEVGQMIVQ